MKNEIWKDVIGYEGLYQVSNLGHIKSLFKGKRLNKILKCHKNHNGYLTVQLSKNGCKKKYKIHQLVAMSYLNHVPCGMRRIIDHIDNNKLNNCVENLRVVSTCENHYANKNNTKKSSYKWIYFENNKWRVRIYLKNKRINIGTFNTEKIAIKKLNKYLLSPNSLSQI